MTIITWTSLRRALDASGRLGRAGLVLLAAPLGCSQSSTSKPDRPAAETPFRSFTPVAEADPGSGDGLAPSAGFVQPRVGVPLPDGNVAFIARSTDDGGASESLESGRHDALFVARPGGMPPERLNTGDRLVLPLDLDVSHDGSTLYVADAAAGPELSGALLAVPLGGGAVREVVVGFSPRSVAIAPDDRLYFSGTDPGTGRPGVFSSRAGEIEVVHLGAPLVDPSGIALRSDGALLIADTRAFESRLDSNVALDSEAAIILIQDGRAHLMTSGFATGYPAGVALTTDERTLIVSGEGPDRRDTIFLVDMAAPAERPTAITGPFSAWQDSSAGLKRSHRDDTFIWASLAANGGTVYQISTH